jgi:pimeloyl-ACP methyl ester carboxylesterase
METWEMTKRRIWVLPGMGADSRIFRNITFPWPATFLEWIVPRREETLDAYTERLLAPHPIEPTDLIFGYSFGGIVGQCWGKNHSCAGIILLNSLHFSNSHRRAFDRLNRIGILHWGADHWLRNFIFFMARLNSRPNEKLESIIEMMEQFDNHYYQWVIERVLTWDHAKVETPIYSLCGSEDVVFPVCQNGAKAWTLQGANHLSFQTHAAEISKVLKEQILPLVS